MSYTRLDELRMMLFAKSIDTISLIEEQEPLDAREEVREVVENNLCPDLTNIVLGYYGFTLSDEKYDKCVREIKATVFPRIENVKGYRNARGERVLSAYPDDKIYYCDYRTKGTLNMYKQGMLRLDPYHGRRDTFLLSMEKRLRDLPNTMMRLEYRQEAEKKRKEALNKRILGIVQDSATRMKEAMAYSSLWRPRLTEKS